MKTIRFPVFSLMFLVLASVRTVQAADDSPFEQFLGSPLLILVALLIIAGVAVLYHRIIK